MPDCPVVILYRGGRLPAWHQLDAADQHAYQEEHVDLMLRVAREHGLTRIEGFRLLAPQGDWERWWTMEFADFAGAEAWMAAEVAPPYGRYGYYEYELARPWRPHSLEWLPRRPAPVADPDANPHLVPALSVDRGSLVVLAFGRWARGSDGVDPATRGDAGRLRHLQAVAEEHGLLHGEVFRLVGAGRDGDLAQVLEFPDLAGAEAWIDAERTPPASAFQQRAFHLARRWAPAYFSSWSCRP